MKRAWTMMLFAAACGGGGSTSPDAAPDAPPDAGDAQDAGPLVDTDGDGVDDSVDVCPTIADPAQVDLDGDHVGWLCDPVESTTLQHAGVSSDFKLAVRGDTVGAAFQYGCATGTCEATAVSVGPGGVWRADSSTETWLAGRPSWGWVAGEDRVLWSFVAGGIGEQNAASHAFTMKYDGGLQGSDEFGTSRLERDQLTVLPSHSPTQGYALLEPRADGELFIIAESAQSYDVELVAGHDPASLLFTLSAQATRSLQRFLPGATASVTETVGAVALSHADDVKAIAAHGDVLGLCASQDGARYFIPIDDNAATSQALPLPSCNVYGAQTADHRLRVIVAGIDGAHPTGGVAFALDGVMHELAIAPYGVEVFGRSVPAVVRSLDPEDGSQIVNVVTATGAVQQIATDLTNAVVSAEGETIHVLAKRGADRVLFRYRGGTVDEVTLTGLAATTEEPQLFTTKEGAALISTSTTAFVVPSQSMTATAIAYHGLRSFVRGDATLVFTGAGLYSYGEVDGVPSYTLLTDDATDLLYAYPLDGYDGAVTKWFAYVKGGACVLARPDGAGATVTLAGNVSCLVGAVVDGVTRDDKLVVRAGNNIGLEELFLLDGDAVTEVASSTSQIQLMYATKDSHVVLGWIGTDTTDQGFLCLGTHPERCWLAPGGARTWAAPVAGQPDAIHAVFLRQLTGAVELTSIKSIGSGTRSQPL